MYKIYGITQGLRDVDKSVGMPWIAQPGTKDIIGFYLWCIKGDKTTVVVDTGMSDREVGFMCTVENYGGINYLKDKFKQINVDPAYIKVVIVTHLHSDHFSAYQLYPNATFYIQKKEIEFLTGPASKFFQVAQFGPDVSEIMSLEKENRIKYLDGDAQIAPGIKVVRVGGHTPGSQVVTVTTRKGEAVICADALDQYENLEKNVVGMYANLEQALLAFDRIKALASSPELIIPGHDPLVMKKFFNPFEKMVEIGD
jgi:glyoxylase-like metal-dependent hydrolase (beta-lactamase superfamily II)